MTDRLPARSRLLFAVTKHPEGRNYLVDCQHGTTEKFERGATEGEDSENLARLTLAHRAKIAEVGPTIEDGPKSCDCVPMFGNRRSDA